MRILLDECCNRRIARVLAGFDVATVQKKGWGGIQNGDLLLRIEGQCDVFITQDQNLPRQNPIAKSGFGVIELKTKGGRWSEREPLMARLRDAIPRVECGTIIVIGA